MSLSTVIGLMAQLNKASEVTAIAANIYHPTPGVDDGTTNKAGSPPTNPSPATAHPASGPQASGPAQTVAAGAPAVLDDIGLDPVSGWVDPAEAGPDLRASSNPMAAALASLRLPAGAQLTLLPTRSPVDTPPDKGNSAAAGQPAKTGPDVTKGGTADLLVSTQSALKLAMGDIKPATQLNGLYLALKPDIPSLRDDRDRPSAATDASTPASLGQPASKTDVPAVKFPVLAPLATENGLDNLKTASDPGDSLPNDPSPVSDQSPKPAAKLPLPANSLFAMLQTAPPSAFSVADLQMADDDMSSLIDAMIVNSQTGAQGKLDDLAKPKPTFIKVDMSLTPGDVSVHDSPDATVIAVSVGRVETTTATPDVDQRAHLNETANETSKADKAGQTDHASGPSRAQFGNERPEGKAVDPGLSRELNAGLDRLDTIENQPLSDISRPVMESAIGGAILNAAMIPGWPPPRPFANAMVKQLLNGDPKQAEESLLEVLKSLGIGKKLMERMREKLKEIRRKLEALINIGVLYTTVMSVMETLADELQALADEEEDEQRGSFFGGRHRIADR